MCGGGVVCAGVGGLWAGGVWLRMWCVGRARGGGDSHSQAKDNSLLLFPFFRACVCVCVCVQLLRRVQLFATLWTVACQTPLSMGFSRQEYKSGLLFSTPGHLPNPGIEPMSLRFLWW